MESHSWPEEEVGKRTRKEKEKSSKTKLKGEARKCSICNKRHFKQHFPLNKNKEALSSKHAAEASSKHATRTLTRHVQKHVRPHLQ